MGSPVARPAASRPRADSQQPFADEDCTGLCILHQLESLLPSPKRRAPSYLPVSSIPRTSSARLSQPDASPSPFPSEPVPAVSIHLAPTKPATILYLAYGSNLCAETFLGRRGIRPLSAVSVTAPSLRLIFDLPGLPYAEPCFANTALRKIPGKLPLDPPKFPPEIPDLPPHDPPFTTPPHPSTDDTHFSRDAAGDPVWNGGLIGVVYEVTPEDFAKIMATEGGGASYHEILVPCLALPPTVGIPEKPSVPELPKPFVARTLCAPRLPDLPDNGDKESRARDGDDGGDNPPDDDDPELPPPPPWFRKLLLPVRRPDPEYAQPSARYLKLLADGAREHDLPGDYQAYLEALQPYILTTRLQFIGRIIFLLFWAPSFLLVLSAGRLLADGKGRVPPWLAAAMTILFNVVWISYDVVAKPIFGEGERTAAEDDRRGISRSRGYSGIWWRKDGNVDEEKRCLLEEGGC
ncbi:hypothetical protein B0T25DRAFT_3371 [Lasiosphaeria hispida]|uniref:gamma-glutamylcyclotransferase n=1 Tax=Lasiosphaeria hispida TaxID=260671 RepID=A0AAJ0HSZ4_9PEZI|nr:hypothetical protein B0T25DRAFT_3371 [Lasiosphaeria hispida]